MLSFSQGELHNCTGQYCKTISLFSSKCQWQEARCNVTRQELRESTLLSTSTWLLQLLQATGKIEHAI